MNKLVNREQRHLKGKYPRFQTRGITGTQLNGGVISGKERNASLTGLSWVSEAEEMLRTFNCGIGFIMFCAPEHVDELTQILADAGEHPMVIGQLTNRTTDAVVFTGAFA